MVCIRYVCLGSDLEPLLVGAGTEDSVVSSEQLFVELPVWALYLVDQVQWLTVEVLNLKAKSDWLESYLVPQEVRTDISSPVPVPGRSYKTPRSQGE